MSSNIPKPSRQIGPHSFAEVKEMWLDYYDNEFPEISGCLKNLCLPFLPAPEIPEDGDESTDSKFRQSMETYRLMLRQNLDAKQKQALESTKLCNLMNTVMITAALRQELTKNKDYCEAHARHDPIKMWVEIEKLCALGQGKFSFDQLSTVFFAAANAGKMHGPITFDNVNAFEKLCNERFQHVIHLLEAANTSDESPLNLNEMDLLKSFIEKLFVARMIQGYEPKMSEQIRLDISNANKTSVKQPETYTQASLLSQQYIRLSDSEATARIPQSPAMDAVAALGTASAVIDYGSASSPGPKIAARIQKLLTEKTPTELAMALAVERSNAGRARGGGRVKAMADAINNNTRHNAHNKTAQDKQHHRGPFTDKSKKPTSKDGWKAPPDQTKWCEKHGKWTRHGTAKCTLPDTALVALIDSADCAPPSSLEEHPPSWALLGA